MQICISSGSIHLSGPLANSSTSAHPQHPFQSSSAARKGQQLELGGITLREGGKGVPLPLLSAFACASPRGQLARGEIRAHDAYGRRGREIERELYMVPRAAPLAIVREHNGQSPVCQNGHGCGACVSERERERELCLVASRPVQIY